MKSTKNTSRLKSELDSIKEVLKVNLEMMNDRTKSLTEV